MNISAEELTWLEKYLADFRFDSIEKPVVCYCQPMSPWSGCNYADVDYED